MRVLIHLGYPRTGSTLLQKNIFPVHKQINFLGPNNYHDFNNVKITQNDLDTISMKNNEFDLDKKVISESNKNFIQYFDEDKINVISSEAYTMFQNSIYNFRDLRYLEILLNKNYKNVRFDFLIVLRNHYDLIKSIYHFNYHKISKILRIKDFKLIFDLLDDKIPDEYDFPLKQFLLNYDFYHLHKNLLSKFQNTNIKYLFYEDLKLNKDYFSDELSNFLNIDNFYTRKLFNSKNVNARKIEDNKQYYIKSNIYKFIKSKTYRFIKNKVPFKNYYKKFFIDNFVYSYFKYSDEEEKIFEEKIKKYYRNSNLKFFEQLKIINKFNY